MTRGSSPVRSIDALAAEPTSTMPERDLFRGYAPPAVSRACCCGGWIEAVADDRAIAEAVLLHVSSPMHGAWAVWAGWRYDGRCT